MGLQSLRISKTSTLYYSAAPMRPSPHYCNDSTRPPASRRAGALEPTSSKKTLRSRIAEHPQEALTVNRAFGPRLRSATPELGDRYTAVLRSPLEVGGAAKDRKST